VTSATASSGSGRLVWCGGRMPRLIPKSAATLARAVSPSSMAFDCVPMGAFDYKEGL
jgi:hypothetical protein